MLMMAGVSGAFLTGDLFNLYVWFEVLLIASFGLLVLGSERAADRRRGQIRLPQSLATTLFLIATGYSTAPSARSTWPTSRRKARRLARAAPLMTLAALYLAGLRHEGGGLPGQFLAAGLLPHAAHRDGGAVRRASDQGRRLRAAAHAGHALAGRAGWRFRA